MLIGQWPSRTLALLVAISSRPSARHSWLVGKGFLRTPDALSETVGNWDSRLKFQMAPKVPMTGSYTIGPRVMDPSINRFVGADMYVGAAANLGLQVNPLTGNCYLYAGANPIGMIDDGHKPMFDECKPRTFDSYSRDERRKLVKAGRYCLSSGRFNGTPQPKHAELSDSLSGTERGERRILGSFRKSLLLHLCNSGQAWRSSWPLCRNAKNKRGLGASALVALPLSEAPDRPGYFAIPDGTERSVVVCLDYALGDTEMRMVPMAIKPGLERQVHPSIPGKESMKSNSKPRIRNKLAAILMLPVAVISGIWAFTEADGPFELGLTAAVIVFVTLIHAVNFLVDENPYRYLWKRITRRKDTSP